MSRRRRFPNAQQAQPVAQPAHAVQPAQQAPAAARFSRPVVIDPTRFEISDLRLFSSAGDTAQDAAARAAMIPALIDMLDRVVIGGTAGRPISEFWPLVREVAAQVASAGNPKN